MRLSRVEDRVCQVLAVIAVALLEITCAKHVGNIPVRQCDPQPPARACAVRYVPSFHHFH